MVTALRIALIGAGSMGQQHLEHLDPMDQAQLCAISDPNPQAAEIARARGIPYFADHQQMLAQVKPQAAIIANPNNLHVQTAIDCLNAGVAVLLEKPVGVHLDEVRELVKVSQATGVAVLVGHHRRHNPLISKARQMLDEGALGQLTSVTAMWQLRKPDDYFEIPWRRQPGAGMLLTNLIHDLDLLRYLCGEVQSVQAVTSNQTRGLPNEDNVAVLLQFANGALGSLTGSDAVVAPWSWELSSGENPVYPQQADQPCYLLAGTQGALSLPQLKHWHYATTDAGWHHPLLADVQPHAEGEALTRQLEHFIQVARGQAEPMVSAADAGRTLALIDAIRQAAETGQACVPAPI